MGNSCKDYFFDNSEFVNWSKPDYTKNYVKFTISKNKLINHNQIINEFNIRFPNLFIISFSMKISQHIYEIVLKTINNEDLPAGKYLIHFGIRNENIRTSIQNNKTKIINKIEFKEDTEK